MTNQLLEVEVVHDTFISGVGQVELLGVNARITLYVEREAMGGGEPDKIVVGKVIVPIDAIPACIAAVVKATWHRLVHMSLLEVAVADRIVRH